MVQPEHLVPLVRMVFLDLMEHRGRMAFQENREYKVRLEKLEWLVRLERMAYQAI